MVALWDILLHSGHGVAQISFLRDLEPGFQDGGCNSSRRACSMLAEGVLTDFPLLEGNVKSCYFHSNVPLPPQPADRAHWVSGSGWMAQRYGRAGGRGMPGDGSRLSWQQCASHKENRESLRQSLMPYLQGHCWCFRRVHGQCATPKTFETSREIISTLEPISCLFLGGQISLLIFVTRKQRDPITCPFQQSSHVTWIPMELSQALSLWILCSYSTLSLNALLGGGQFSLPSEHGLPGKEKPNLTPALAP